MIVSGCNIILSGFNKKVSGANLPNSRTKLTNAENKNHTTFYMKKISYLKKIPIKKTASIKIETVCMLFDQELNFYATNV